MCFAYLALQLSLTYIFLGFFQEEFLKNKTLKIKAPSCPTRGHIVAEFVRQYPDLDVNALPEQSEDEDAETVSVSKPSAAEGKNLAEPVPAGSSRAEVAVSAGSSRAEAIPAEQVKPALKRARVKEGSGAKAAQQEAERMEEERRKKAEKEK